MSYETLMTRLLYSTSTLALLGCIAAAYAFS